MKYQIAVVDRSTVFRNDSRAVAHCVRGDTIEVEFDTEWNEVDHLVANFVNRADGERKTIDMTSTRTVEIPWEVMRTQGEMYVTFIGWVGDERRYVTKLMDNPFIIQKAEAVDLVVPEATKDILITILTMLPLLEEAREKALGAASRAEVAAESIGTSTVTRAEFDSTVNELAGLLANYIGRIWWMNKVIYVPAEQAELDGDVLRVQGYYDEETETLWIGEIDG